MNKYLFPKPRSDRLAASTNEENRASVDYTEQVESMRAILNEADLY